MFLDEKKLDKEADKRINVIIFMIPLVALSFYYIMKSEIFCTDMATYWASYGTVLQALFAGFQAVFAGILIIITKYLAKKQAALILRQNEIVEEQKEMTRRQIQLSLYDKRYKLYRTLEDTLEKDFLSMQFPAELQQNDQEYLETYNKKLFALKILVRDRVFLLDADTNEIIDKVFDDVENIIKNISDIYFYTDYKGIRGEREAMRYTEANEQRSGVNGLMNDIHKEFERILDFKNI